VNRHKVTMVHHLLSVARPDPEQEAIMVALVPDTPAVQSALRNEKTFTRERDHTLPLHLSCIHSGWVPFTDEPADVSGRCYLLSLCQKLRGKPRSGDDAARVSGSLPRRSDAVRFPNRAAAVGHR